MAAHRRALRRVDGVVGRILSAADPLALALVRVCAAFFAHVAGDAITYDRPKGVGWFAADPGDVIRLHPDGDESEYEIGRAVGIVWTTVFALPLVVLLGVLAVIPTHPVAWVLPIALIATVMLRVLEVHDRVAIEVTRP